MALIRWEQFDPVGSMLALQGELGRVLRNPAYNLGLSGYGAYPPINIFDDGEGLAIMAELPGVEPASVNLVAQRNTLTLTGNRAREEAKAPGAFHRREREFGEFSRSIQLPEGLDLEKTTARFESGVLTVKIPKSPEAKPRQIAVETA